MTHIIVSDQVHATLYNQLKKVGMIHRIIPTSFTYPAIADHADIYCAVIGSYLVLHSSQSHLLKEGINHQFVMMEEELLGHDYPHSALMNAVAIGDRVFHHKKACASAVRSVVERQGFTLVHVNQGYTRCNTLVLHNKERTGVITEDRGLAKIYVQQGYDVLRIKPSSVQLEGLNHGFLAGTAGVHGRTVYMNGDLSRHEEGDRVRGFIGEYGYELVEAKGEPLVDIGSILFFEEDQRE